MKGRVDMSDKMQQFEYCFLAEDTSPDATQVKIFIPKLQGMMPMSNSTQSSSFSGSSLKNEGGGSGGSVTQAGYITARMQDPYSHKHSFHDCPGNCPNVSHDNTCGSTSCLNTCNHFHHDHHLRHVGEHGTVPAGSRMICCIMNGSVKDIIVTRLEVKFPGEF